MGSRQQSRFIALMENYDRTMELIDTAYDSAGRSSEQFSKYQDTLEYKLKQLQNTWEQFRTKFFSSEFFKNIIDGLNKILNLVKDFDLKKILSLGVIGITLGKSVITNFTSELQKGTQKIQSTWQNVIKTALSSKGKNLFSFDSTKQAFSQFKKMSKKGFINNANQALGSELGEKRWVQGSDETNEAFTQRQSNEYQNTLELQKQLQYYTELAQKKDALIQKGNQEKTTLGNITNETQRQIQEIEKEIQANIKNADKLREQLGYERQITSENASQVSQKLTGALANRQEFSEGATAVGTNAISAGLTAGIMAGIAGADFTEVIKISFTSAIAAALPMIISAIAPFLIKLLTGPIGIAAIVIGTVAGITAAIIKANEAAQKAEENRLKSIKETNEKLQKEQEQNLKDFNNKQDKKTKLEDNIDRYNELTTKSFLNSAEEEEKKSIAENLNENYPEIIKSFDENTSEIEFNTLAIKELKESIDDEIEEERRRIRKNSIQQIANYSDLSNSLEERIEDFNESMMEEPEIWGYETVSINNQSDSELYNKYGINGYILENESAAAFNIANSAKEMLEFVDKSIAAEYGISDEIYETAIEDDFEEFQTALEDSNISLVEFSKAAFDATKAQKESVDNQLIEANRQKVKNELLIDDLDLSEQMAEIFSYVSEDNIDKIQGQVSNSVGKYFKSNDDAYSYFSDGFDKNKDFLRAVQDLNFSGSQKNGEAGKKMLQAMKNLGYDTEADAEEGIKSIDELFDSGTNLVEFDSLSVELKNAITNMGYEKEDFNKIRKTAKEMSRVLQQAITYDIMSQEGILPEGLKPEIFKNNADAITRFEETINDYEDQTLEQYTEQVEEAKNNIKSQELRDSVDQYYEESEDSIKSQWQSALDSLKDAGFTNIDDLSYKTSTYLNDMIKSLNLSETKRGKIVDLIEDNTKGLTQAQKDVLLSIDLTQDYEQLLSHSEEYIDKLIESGKNAEEAAEIFNSYIRGASLILGKGIIGESGAEVLQSTLNQKVKGIKDSYEEIFKAQEEFLENGKLSVDTYLSLQDGIFKKYTKIEDGTKLMLNDIGEAWVAAAKQPEEYLRNAIEINKQIIEDSEKTIGNYGVNKFNDAIKYYKDNQQYVADLSQEQKDLIKDIVDAGYSNYEDFLNAYIEGYNSMIDKLPGVIMLDLISMMEAVQNQKHTIDDLNDSLSDLYKRQADANEKIKEAEDALRQAVHGSDDFKSSLDGLVNYTNKIERLDKAIEKTKTSLEDVSNIDEAKGLLSQLNNQYNDKTVTLGAENIAIDKALDNLQSTLLQNYGNYISFDVEGNPLIDYAYMQMDANDEIRKAFEEEYNLYNEYRSKREENLDAMEDIEKEREERQKESLNNFVSEQEKLISILKEKAQEEIDTTKEKYEALEEADNDYLEALEEAINKQRELRDKQNQYEDLATKEKKLALLQRDTSGANRKEAMSLENEIEDDRQNLLDSEVDNLINSMKELYEKQKEARDAEIEYMETVTDNAQYFAEWAANIMASWQSVEDMQAWYLENDPEAQDMTVEQTEAYLNQIEESWTHLVEYAALSATNFTAQQENLTSAMNLMYENTSNNIENLGTVTQETAQKAADDLIAEATRAKNESIENAQDVQDEINKTNQKIIEAQEQQALLNQAFINELNNQTMSGIQEVADFATKLLKEEFGIKVNKNLQNKKNENISDNLKNYEKKQIKKSNKNIDSKTYSPDFIGPLKYGNQKSSLAKGSNASELSKQNIVATTTTKEPVNETGTIYKIIYGYKNYYTKDQDVANRAKKANMSVYVAEGQVYGGQYHYNYSKYKTGGIVDYTGPAWVDGTPMKPEAFLSADDTKRIGEAAKILANLPVFNSTTNAQNAVSTNVGDTTIEIHINVENIESDYDVDQMIDRVKKDIVDVSKPVGTPVILRR